MRRRRIMALLTALLLALPLMPGVSPGAQAAAGTSWDDDCRANITGKDKIGNVLYGKHDWVLQSETPGDTCTSKGNGTYKCSYCGARVNHPTPAPGHNWGNWETVEEATCTERGEEVHVCRVCGEKETRKTDKAPHTWGEWTEDAGSAGPGGDLTGPDAGEWKTSEQDPCTRQVMETRICKVCGETRSRTTGKASHTWGAWTVILEATDFSAGRRQHSCRVCGTEESEEFDPDPTFRRGDSGEGVKALQEGLNALGYDCGKPDGNFGKKTETAVKAIEKDHGVTADGIAWPGVQKWLRIPISTYSNGESAYDLLSLLRGNPVSTYSNDLPFMITQQPEGGVLDPDDTLTLTVGASGGKKPYSYEWHRYSPLSKTPVILTVPLFERQYLSDHIVSTDGPDYTVSGSEKTDMLYYCIVRDSGTGMETSETVGVGPHLRITRQPQNASIYGKKSVTLSCESDMISRNLSYAWFHEGGAMENSPDQKTITVTATGNYYCEVSDGTDTVRSDTAVVYEAPEPWVKSAETPAYLRPGETRAEISVTFQGGVPPLTCEWFLEGELQTSYISYSVVETKAEWTAFDLGTHVFVLTDAVGNTATGTAEVEYDQLTILEQPKDGKVAKDGGTYTLSVKIGEEAIAPITYTLCRDQEPVKTQVDDSSFTVDQPGIYSIRVSDRWERWAESAEAVVTEYDPFVHIIGHTKSGKITNNSPRQDGKPGCHLGVKAEGGEKPYSYIWYLEGDKVAEKKTYTYFATKPGKYQCRVIDSKGKQAYSGTIPVKYTASKPVIMTQPKDTKIGSSQYAILTCLAKSGSGNNYWLKYTWQRLENGHWKIIGYGQKLKTKNTGFFRCVVKDRKTDKYTISDKARVTKSEKLRFVKVSQKKLSAKKIVLSIQFAGGTRPYSIRIYRREKYQVYSGGQWITKYRNRLIINAKKNSSKSILKYKLNRWYKTIIKGENVKYKAQYIIVITDGTGQKIEKTIKAK